MIKSFTKKRLKLFFEKGDLSGIRPDQSDKVRKILARLNATKELRDMNYPGAGLHMLKKPPYRGFFSVDVNKNYRIVFRIEKEDVYDVDYLDTH